MARKKKNEETSTISDEEQKNNNKPNDQQQITVDIGYISKLNICIALPAYGGNISEATTVALVKWTNFAALNNIKWTLHTLVNESLITRGRNTLTSQFLANPEFTHLFFLDSDIGWEPMHLLMLLDHTKNPIVKLIGGLYPLKKMPLQWNINTLDNAMQQSNGLLEVSKTATGFMLISRDVFGVLDMHQDVHQYNNDLGLDPKLDPYMKSYWECPVINGRMLSEDWEFCRRYRELKGKIWIDTRVQLSHCGYHKYSSDSQLQIINDMVASGIIKQ